MTIIHNHTPIAASENRTTMECSIILDESKSSTVVLLQLFEKKEILDDDSEIEDFCLVSLFQEIEVLPEVLIDEQLNSSSDSEVDSLIGCVTLPQPDEDFLNIDFEENSGDQCFYCLLYFLVILFICYVIAVTAALAIDRCIN